MQKTHQSEPAKRSLTWYSSDTVRYIDRIENLFRFFHLPKTENVKNAGSRRDRQHADDRVSGKDLISYINKFYLR